MYKTFLMPKRKKRGPKLKKTETTTAGETASSSMGISPGSNCDDSAMNVKIEMPKVYGRSNSLFGTFGLLDAQKPAVVKIKKEPAEVDKPKTCDTFNINIENVCEVKLSECSVVLTDLTENLITQEVIGEKQRVTNATEKEPVIVGAFCVEEDNENMLKQLIENKEGDSNFEVKTTIDFPVIGEKQRITDNTEKELLIVGDFCAEKDNENVLEQLIENKESDANFDVETTIDFPVIGKKQRVTDNAEEELVIVGDFCVEKSNENVLEQLIENKENHSNFNVETATDFPIIGEKQKITDNNEKELLIVGDFCVEEDNENMLEQLIENKESNANFEVETTIDFPVIGKKQRVTDNSEKEPVIVGDFCVEKGYENMLEQLIENKESDGNFNVQTTIDFPVTKDEDFHQEEEKHEVTDTDMDIDVNEDIFVKKESDVIKTEYELMEQEESDTDRNMACLDEHSAKEYQDNYLNGTEQNESSINEDIFGSLIKFSAEKDDDYFLKNVKKEFQLKESDADDDIVFLKEVCKKCLITETREGFCCHFPSLVE
ncbi:uncharacterized protein [Parasteatoda tepidariorum]|uniref:uncharacterized protein isoform X2 n=1 Tax=Parasteatoda tepidariorum TaxID=114398 RepID=UPI001C7208BD|nr:uncharacterized protein LOC107445053 isoform X2 [Parasteatoda tepidariorum]